MNNKKAQRLSPGAGLIVTEAVQILPQDQGYSYTPGIPTQEQAHIAETIQDEIKTEWPNLKIIADSAGKHALLRTRCFTPDSF